MIKAVIFDFNGTLFFDGWIHKMIWPKMIEEIIGYKPTDEMINSISGAINLQLLKSINKYRKEPLSDDELNKYSEEKEAIYRKYVLDNNLNKLVDGATNLFDYLKITNIPRLICSASIKANVDFFFDDFGLYKWFDRKEAVYDDGNYQNKKDMYIKCCENLNVDIKDVLIFEDSMTGIIGAKEAGCKNIVLVKSSLSDLNDPCIIQEIDNFKEFDYNILNK